MRTEPAWQLELYLRVDPDPMVEKVARVIYETNDYLQAGPWHRMFPKQKEPFYNQAHQVLKAIDGETPLSDLQVAVDAAQEASHHAQQADLRLNAIEGALVMMLRAEGRSFSSIRRLFPYMTLPDIKALSGETP